MRTSRTRTLYHLSLAGLALLALRPVDPLVRALDVLLAPSAVLSHLCAPLAWMGGRPVIAGEGQEEAAYAAQLALEQAVLASAEPQNPLRVEKLAGMRALRAEVSGRPRDDRDRIWLRLAQAGNLSSLRTGDAVVSGDAFIGTVDVEASRLTAQVGVVEVQLVTGAQFRVGAEIDPEDSRFTGPIVRRRRMVVGGLAPHPDRILLAVHNPEQPGGVGARVIVSETVRVGVRTHLANGFVLGVLARGIPAAWEHASARLAEESLLGIQPIMDFAHGLHQVLILTDSEPEAIGNGATEMVLPVQDAAAWRSTQLLLRGESSPLRAGRKISSGSVNGVSVGAAVSVGTHLLGRVIRVGPLGADLSLLADPGLRISTIALLQDGSGKRPHVLGQLTSLGKGAAGSVRFHWPATLTIEVPSGWEPDVGLPAQIWTGSGDDGLPRGLLIGETDLPFGPGPHIIEVRLAADGPVDHGTQVWVGAPAGTPVSELSLSGEEL